MLCNYICTVSVTAHYLMIKYIRNTKKQNTCKTYIWSIVSQYCLKPATPDPPTPPPHHQPLQTHNPELPFIIHYSVLYNFQCTLFTLDMTISVSYISMVA